MVVYTDTGRPSSKQPGETIVRGRRLPALDGVRAVAILAVLFFHLGHPFLAGGYLGVDLFFILSGFLITSLLLEERAAKGSVGLGAFYVRRARRLLPGLYVLLASTIGAVNVMGRWLPAKGPVVPLHQLRGDAVATVFYVANWYMQVQGTGRYVATRALGQVWSLSIEEQFYLVWPAVMILIVTWGAMRWRRAGLVITLAATLASSAYMATLASSGPLGPMHAYLNTFSRAFDLFLGAALAFLLASGSSLVAPLQRAARFAAPLCAVGLGIFFSIGERGAIIKWPSPFMYRGGFLIAGILAVVVICDATADAPSVIGRALRWAPMVWIGLISYGLYLYHWPVNFFLSEDVVGFGGIPLDALHLLLTFAVAALSFYLIERPLRRASYTGWKRAAWPAATVIILLVAIVGTIPSLAQPVAGPPPTAAVLPGTSGTVPGSGGIVGLPLRPPLRTNGQALSVALIGDDSMRRLAGALLPAFASTGQISAHLTTGVGWGLLDSNGVPASASDVSQNISLSVFGIHQHGVGVVVLTWAAGDQLSLLRDPSSEAGAMSTLVNQIVADQVGTDVLFLGQPSPTAQGSAQEALATRRWNAIARGQVALHPGRVAFLPVNRSVDPATIAPVWLPPSNRPSAAQADWVRVRMTDGISVCQPGVVRMSAATIADFGLLFGTGPASGSWWRGPWTDYLRYDEPGRCLNDHP